MEGHRSKDKRYSGDNRLIPPKSSYRRSGLAPRCRLVTSWGWRRSQGLGCSPIKVARELGSERRETVRSLSIVGVWNLRGSDTSTRGPCWTDLWFYRLCRQVHRRVSKSGLDKCWKHLSTKPATRLDFLGSSKTMTLIGCRCIDRNKAEHY